MRKQPVSLLDRVLRAIGALIPDAFVRRVGGGLAHPALRSIPQCAASADANRALAQLRNGRRLISPEEAAADAQIARSRAVLERARAARISRSSEDARFS